MTYGEFVGNNMEFVVADISDVTIYFNEVGTNTLTDRYPHTSDNTKKFTAKRFLLRADQTIQILSINDFIFTDPVTVILNTPYRETREQGFITKMKIRTTVVNTLVRVRWHGGY